MDLPCTNFSHIKNKQNRYGYIFERRIVVIKLKSRSNVTAILVLICFLWAGCASTSQTADQDQPALEAASDRQASHYKTAEELLSVFDMDTLLQTSMAQMLEIQLQRNPSIKPYKHVLMEFFAKYMSYESLKDDLIKMYVEVFSEKELREVIAFYKTPTGQKAIEKVPELMKTGAQLGAERLESHKDELIKMIEKESKRIQGY